MKVLRKCPVPWKIKYTVAAVTMADHGGVSSWGRGCRTGRGVESGQGVFPHHQGED